MDIFQKFSKTILRKYQYRIILTAAASVMCFMIIVILLSNSGLNDLYHFSSSGVKSNITKLNEEFITSHINETAELVQMKLQRFKDDQSILADLFQKYIDNEQQFSKITTTILDMPYFKDKLKFNGRWSQNTPDEPSVLLVERYFMDKQGNIKPETKYEIDRSLILDYLMPSFYKYSSKKLWLYFEGSKKASFMRITPWDDIGKKMDEVYPKFTDVDIWDTFNPGLVEAWTKQLRKHPDYKKDLSKLYIMKPPTQDGASGKTIMTMDIPVWSKDRNSFQGAIILDVELNEIIKMITEVKLAKTGFAYITQADGNILALNENGINTLGLKNSDASTVKGSSGYNNMLRYFKDSSYKDVKQLANIGQQDFVLKTATINGKEYLIAQKRLKPLQLWTKDKGIYSEKWALGFIVPMNELYSSFDSIKSAISDTKNNITKNQIVLVFLSVAIMMLFIVLGVNRYSKPLEQITAYASDIAAGDLEKSLPKEFLDKQDDIGVLSRAIEVITEAFRKENEILEMKINEKNKELEDQYKYILETEKMASLGNLVAGVAHEINTPLGTSLTTLSYLKKINHENRQKLSEGKMSKSNLETFMEELDSSIEIMNINMTRAAELVKSFKKIAVDQASESKIKFHLYDNIESVIISLRHEYKNTNHKVINECPKDIVINSYPGAFSQVLTNFIMNSLIHGFKEKDDGNIRISADYGENGLKLVYSDDGTGMPQEMLDKMYEPFRTTNRTGGSSGLGLHIIRNIVSRQLLGTISYEPSEGGGAKFIIQIPLSKLL